MTSQQTMLVEREDGTYKALEILDLYDLALLLSYERYTLQPRFRHTMLFDVASGAEEFAGLASLNPLWGNPTKRSKRIGFAFTVDDDGDDERDKPDDMQPLSIFLPRVHVLSARQLETTFYQARAHNACFASIALLRFLFALYDDDQPVHTPLGTGMELVAFVAAHSTAKYILREPRQMTMSILLTEQPMLEPRSMKAIACSTALWLSVQSPSSAPPEQKSAVLDLASMQFGDSRRGRGALFVIERMRGIAQSVTGPEMGGPYITNDDERWLEDVGRRVKT